MFLGAEQPAREVDCVLIYDEDTGVCLSFYIIHWFINFKLDIFPRKTGFLCRSSL
jgi:hypothetical protein